MFIITNIIVNILNESNDTLKSKLTRDEKYDSDKIKEDFKIIYLVDIYNVKLWKNKN
jgi:archaellum component FlaG (FlaF/FlaG flagellin family)